MTDKPDDTRTKVYRSAKWKRTRPITLPPTATIHLGVDGQLAVDQTTPAEKPSEE